MLQFPYLLRSPRSIHRLRRRRQSSSVSIGRKRRETQGRWGQPEDPETSVCNLLWWHSRRSRHPRRTVRIIRGSYMLLLPGWHPNQSRKSQVRSEQVSFSQLHDIKTWDGTQGSKLVLLPEQEGTEWHASTPGISRMLSTTQPIHVWKMCN